ncbi:TIP41-domain-containing protein [Nadsonia fulvescens var. elongata DSM 6958]|uniref:TIP41-domain-containing protein n=1 Tax=Nadsonia fulvescens var. elongata DSM 6958 TaxID=857566 RepID=A0A1E3PP71_9ASCO|nr:TIP41-domain-containing protein [Nadsonia fulvescens var. elongata DSM 6958]
MNIPATTAFSGFTSISTPPAKSFLPPPNNEKLAIAVDDWRIYTTHNPILNSVELDKVTESIGIPMPEMIFGNNGFRLLHEPSGWEITFDALNAVDGVDKTGDRDGLLKVSCSQDWLKSRQKRELESKISGVVKPFDWTYSVAYSGNVTPSPNNTNQISFEVTEERIPIDKLKRPDPILFFDNMILYEDELSDNGSSVLDIKIRVMPERLLLLCRFFLRIDGVLFRIRDSRTYIEFKTGEVIREFQTQEATYESLRKKIPSYVEDYGVYLRDPNWVSQHIPIQSVMCEKAIIT